MDEIRALAPTGMLGSGYFEGSLLRAMEWEPHFIACDAGSTDGGPDPLATGKCQFSKSAVKRDVLDYLTEASAAAIGGNKPPSMLPNPLAVNSTGGMVQRVEGGNPPLKGRREL